MSAATNTVEYSIDELMVVTLARAFDNTTRAFNGAVSFIPVCAYLLARKTHAPELVWAASSIAIDADPAQLGESTLSDSIWDGAAMLSSSPFDFWAYAQGRHYNTFAFRGAQIDRFGNVNNTVIGPYHAPKVRLPGGGGMADSGIGWGDGGNHRSDLGLPGGPQLCVTNLCVMDFHPGSKAMRIRSLHPGVSLEEVREATGFDLLLPDGEIATTAEPLAKELKILREEVDPTSMRLREFPP